MQWVNIKLIVKQEKKDSTITFNLLNEVNEDGGRVTYDKNDIMGYFVGLKAHTERYVASYGN